MNCRRPVHRRNTNTYNSECPYCNEGNSKGIKRRFFYIVDEDKLYCHNCQISKTSTQFIMDMNNYSYFELMQELEKHDSSLDDVISYSESIQRKKNDTTLPQDSINLTDKLQVKYYQNNVVIQDALKVINERRLDRAINKPKTLWISLTDDVHRNRIIFPFYDYDDLFGISFYQTRAIYDVDAKVAKYLSKVNGDKTIFNLQNVDINIPYLFATEGPIDCCFIKNGIALVGLVMTKSQKDTLHKYFPFHELIYVLDNQRLDESAYRESEKLLERGETVFIWPSLPFKDINEWCIEYKVNHIPYDFFVKNSFKGLEGLVKLKSSRRRR